MIRTPLRSAVLALAALSAAAQTGVLSRATVYRHPSSDPYDRANRSGFNHAPNVTVLPDGGLMAVWFSGPFEASVHQLILASYSRDGGRNWTPAETFHDFPRRSDFDPALLGDSRRVWCFFSAGRWDRYPFVSDEKNNVGANSFQIYERHSDDSGHSWSQAAPAQIERGFNCRANGIRLSTGELLLPVYRLPERQAGVLKSSDGGRTWRRFGRILTPAGQDEPTIAERPDGAVLMMLRTSGGTMWSVLSRDKGETWDAPKKLDFPAARASHSIFRLRDGRLALTYDASPSFRTPLVMRISPDGGDTWGEPLKLADVPETGPGAPVRYQVTYPSVTQLPDGTVLALWAHIAVGDTEQWGDIESARIGLR